MEIPQPNEQLYRKSFQDKLAVIKQRYNDLNTGLTSVVSVREILDKFFDKKLNEFEELLIHIEELDYSYSENRITHAEYLVRNDAFEIRLEHAASEALDTNEGSRFLEDQLTAELLKGVPSQDWRNMQIQHGEAMSVLEDVLRRNTLEDEGTPPRNFVDGDPEDPDNINYLLDQVTGIWHDEDTEFSALTVAHLVPHQFVSKPLESLCGISKKDMHNFRNGLLMHRNLQSAFDKGIICFVPKTLTEPTPWKCIVVKTSMMNRTFDRKLKVSEFHNKTLTFLTDDRPSRTACYFRFLTAWLRASTAQRMGIESAHNLKGLRFVTPTKMVDASVLSALALHVGDKKDWVDMQASQGHTFYEGSNANTSALAQLQGVRLGRILLTLTTRSKKLEEGETIESDVFKRRWTVVRYSAVVKQ